MGVNGAVTVDLFCEPPKTYWKTSENTGFLPTGQVTFFFFKPQKQRFVREQLLRAAITQANMIHRHSTIFNGNNAKNTLSVH